MQLLQILLEPSKSSYNKYNGTRLFCDTMKMSYNENQSFLMSVKQQVPASIHPTVNAVSIRNQSSQKVVNGATSGLRYRLSLLIATIRRAVISDKDPPLRHHDKSGAGRRVDHFYWCEFNDTLLVGDGERFKVLRSSCDERLHTVILFPPS